MGLVHYLDHAATSAIRPPEVVEAMRRYLDEVGATPGRGGHRLAVEAGRIVLDARTRIRDLLGRTGDPGRVVFGPNATWGMNTALHGLLGAGDVLVHTVFDHNAALRPGWALAQSFGIELRIVPGDASGALDLDAFRRALDGATLVTLNAASNVLGSTLPIAPLVEEVHAAGALALVDSAQVLGHLPFDFGDADLIAFTGHKGLLGPQGTGGLWIRPGLEVVGSHQGGTGGASHERAMPTRLPDALEPGTLNGPGLAGLAAGARRLAEHGLDRLHRETAALKARLIEGVDALPGVRRLTPHAPDGVGIVTVAIADGDPADVARRLDRDHGVLTRAGLHCAPEAHRLLGTLETGGLRLSVGWGSTSRDIDAAVEALDRCTAPVQRFTS